MNFRLAVCCLIFLSVNVFASAAEESDLLSGVITTTLIYNNNATCMNESSICPPNSFLAPSFDCIDDEDGYEEKLFQDPIPPGNILVSVNVTYFGKFYCNDTVGNTAYFASINDVVVTYVTLRNEPSVIGCDCSPCVNRLSFLSNKQYNTFDYNYNATNSFSVTMANNYICLSSVNLTFTFKPVNVTLLTITPTSGTTEGGTNVSITGNGFNKTSNAKWVCKFGNDSVDLQVATMLNNYTITCLSPSFAPGNVSVFVSGDDGLSFSQTSLTFTFLSTASTSSGVLTTDNIPTNILSAMIVHDLVKYWWVVTIIAVAIVVIVISLVIAIRSRMSVQSQSYSSMNSNSPLAPLLSESSSIYGTIQEDIDVRELKMAERIGRGNFGEVFVANWRGTIVAVKKTKFPAIANDDEKAQFLEDFEHEAAIMRNLRHPNVLQFLGICSMKSEICIITEFLPKGSLYRLLHDKATAFSWDLRLRVAVDVSRGMNYLHKSKPIIIHRDLKSHNLLVDDNFKVKVCDFGLAKLLSSKENQGSMTACGTPAYTAPEVLRNERYTEKVDVFSFGIVMWELVTREEPHHGVPPFQIVFSVGTQGVRPTIPDSCLPEIRELIEDCWTEDPNERPSFEQIVYRLEIMIKNMYR